MRFLGGLVLLAGAGLAWLNPPADDWTVIVGGDTDGYLSPCGCTKPMSGGIRRRAQATRLLAGRQALILENGGLIAGTGRQDILKAEALAQALGAMKVDALNLTASEARNGPGLVGSLERLSGSLVATSLAESPSNEIPRLRLKGPFRVAGLSTRADEIARDLRERAVPESEAVEELLEAGGVPIVLLDGSRTQAEALARRHPQLRLIVFRSSGSPSDTPLKIGETWLASPGEKGKAVLRLRFSGGRFTGYEAVNLGPEFGDDPAASRAFRTYLTRVEEERLLEALPRRQTAPFAGNAACGKCHTNAMKVWEKSEHAHALKTLEREGQARDPDCVSCHVVALDSTRGFRDRKSTPQLANVGCESCHGPGLAHSLNPKLQMGKVGEKSCAPCHIPGHSPNFDYLTYWRKIAH